MPRTIKADKTMTVFKVVPEVLEEVIEEVEQPVKLVAPVKPVNKTMFIITAKFKTRTKEGDRIIHRYTGKSSDPLLALNLICEEPEESVGIAYPPNLNLLVEATLQYSDLKHTRSLAPHVARDIFGVNKNIKLFFKLMLTPELKAKINV